MLTSPGDVAEAYKNTTTLNFDRFMDDTMKNCGVSAPAVAKMWLSAAEGFHAPTPNPDGKCLAQLTRDFHRYQLLHGDEQTELTDRFIDEIDRALTWNILGAREEPLARYKHAVAGDGTPSSVKVYLKQWCGDVLVNAATRAFFGDAMLDVSPDLLRDFFTFDDNSWMLIYRVPRFLATDLYRGLDATVDGLQRYFELPREKRGGKEAWFVKSLETSMRGLGIGVRDIAKMFLMVYWV